MSSESPIEAALPGEPDSLSRPLYAVRSSVSARRALWRRVALGLAAGLFLLLVATAFALLSFRRPHPDLPPWDSAVPWSLCSEEDGPGSPRHELFLNRLNGRRIAFVGDCILRYQYIELAYYLIHGHCPDPRRPGYILSEKHWSGGFNEFLSKSSAALNMHSAALNAQEFVFGGRYNGKMLPLFTAENRVFTFLDKQGRKIELMYLNFYTEQYGTLGLALTSADLLHPTDVIVNFGVWLSDTPPNTTCGATRSYWPNIGRCPYMHDVCEYFMGKASTHAFNLWWATTTPGLDKKDLSRVIEKVPFGHNLNAESACGLPPDMVLDREAMLNRVEPDKSKQPALFEDTVHFSSPEPYHAFNWMLLHRLRKLAISSENERHEEALIIHSS